MTRLGFIGTGHLATFFVQGLRRARWPCEIVLSPRGAAVAADLAREHGASVASSNQDVVDRVDLVVASVLPDMAENVLGALRFRADQVVLSVMAAVPLAAVSALVRPAKAAVAMMPGHANALGLGPSCLHPPEPAAQALLAQLGPVVTFEDEAQFIAAAAFGGLSGMTFGWMADLAAWFERRGLDARTARWLVAATLRGNAEVLLAADSDFDAIVRGIAPPGGITELGNRVLATRGGHAGWREALDAIAIRIETAAKAAAQEAAPER